MASARKFENPVPETRQKASGAPSYATELTHRGRDANDTPQRNNMPARNCISAEHTPVGRVGLGDEVARVKLEARLDDGAIRKIRESVAEVVKASAKQRAADGRTRSNGLVDLKVAEAISRAIKERSGELACGPISTLSGQICFCAPTRTPDLLEQLSQDPKAACKEARCDPWHERRRIQKPDRECSWFSQTTPVERLTWHCPPSFYTAGRTIGGTN